MTSTAQTSMTAVAALLVTAACASERSLHRETNVELYGHVQALGMTPACLEGRFETFVGIDPAFAKRQDAVREWVLSTSYAEALRKAEEAFEESEGSMDYASACGRSKAWQSQAAKAARMVDKYLRELERRAALTGWRH